MEECEALEEKEGVELQGHRIVLDMLFTRATVSNIAETT